MQCTRPSNGPSDLLVGSREAVTGPGSSAEVRLISRLVLLLSWVVVLSIFLSLTQYYIFNIVET